MTGVTLCDCFPQQYTDLADVSASQDAERVRVMLRIHFFQEKGLHKRNRWRHLWSTDILRLKWNIWFCHRSVIWSQKWDSASHPNSALFQGKNLTNIYLKLPLVWENAPWTQTKVLPEFHLLLNCNSHFWFQRPWFWLHFLFCKLEVIPCGPRNKTLVKQRQT